MVRIHNLVNMAPSPSSPARSTGQRLSPSSLPGRDHVADADSSQSRKRPRLSDEPDTPTYTDGNSSHSSDNPNTSATESPVILEVPQELSTGPSEISIIVNGDGITADVHLNSFPFVSNGDTPEVAAVKLAGYCHKKSGMFVSTLHLRSVLTSCKAPKISYIIELYTWLDDHLNQTSNDFGTALKHNITSSTIFDIYSDNKDFWNDIVSCFRGLIGRR